MFGETEDINWHDIRWDEKFRDHPDQQLLIKTTNGVVKISMSKYIRADNITMEFGEEVLFWAFLNQPN